MSRVVAYAIFPVNFHTKLATKRCPRRCPRQFFILVPHGMALVKYPCACRLRRLAQSVFPRLGTGPSSSTSSSSSSCTSTSSSSSHPHHHHHHHHHHHVHHQHHSHHHLHHHHHHHQQQQQHCTTLSFYCPSHCLGSLAGIMIFVVIYYCSWVYHIQRLPGQIDPNPFTQRTHRIKGGTLHGFSQVWNKTFEVKWKCADSSHSF